MQSPGARRFLLLHGPNGVGKTTLAKLVLSRRSGSKFVSSDDWDDDDFLDRVAAAANSPGYGILLDHVEGIPDAKLSETFRHLRALSEKRLQDTPVIICCDNPYKSNTYRRLFLAKDVSLVPIPRPSSEALRMYASRVVSVTSVAPAIRARVMHRAIESCSGAANFRSVALGIAWRVGSSGDRVFDAPIATTNSLFAGKFRVGKKLFPDVWTERQWIWTNMTAMHAQSIEAVADIADDLSTCDILDSQHHGWWWQEPFTTGAVSVHVRKLPQTHRGIVLNGRNARNPPFVLQNFKTTPKRLDTALPEAQQLGKTPVGAIPAFATMNRRHEAIVSALSKEWYSASGAESLWG